VENLGFIITVNNVRLFHSGDMEPDAVWLSTLQSYSLPELNLDVAILPEFMFTESTYHKRITEGVRATHLIPMHFAGSPAAQIIDEFPQAVLFKHSLETWSLP
jgi:L-ascorbate metabolism protein UlaG (beta-lactamase superfamily)